MYDNYVWKLLFLIPIHSFEKTVICSSKIAYHMIRRLKQLSNMEQIKKVTTYS